MNIDVDQEYILQNERVLLRPLEPGDWEHLLPFALNEPGLWKYSLVSAAGRQGMQQYVETAVIGRQQKKEYPFIVYDKAAQQYAGSTRFYDIQPQYGTLQLGYTWYGKAFQRTGLNRHCKWLLLGFAFETLGAERVEFRADNDNKASIAAMQAIGCVAEGVLRSHLPRPDGGRRHSIVLSILKEEWLGAVKSRLQAMVHQTY